MDRREFTRICSGLLAGASALQASANGLSQLYTRSSLEYDDNSPVTLDSLASGQAYIFSYPYKTTPCFQIRLATPARGGDEWPAGIGEDQSVVAFSAICSHKMSHPARPISHISYRADPVSFRDRNGVSQERGQVISCCSERSVYDPAAQGAVLSGPAQLPLAAIALEANEAGEVSAIGSIGPDQYDRFLDKFGFRLAMEYGVTDVRARIGERTLTTPAEMFSKQQIRC